jgi:outer membrane immunogenic protein
MKKAALGIIAIAALIGTPALAADMALKAPPPAPVYSWTGCYIGIEGGGDWGSSHHTGPAFGGVDIAAPFSLSGGLVGGTLGCNYQAKQWVFGIEGDGSWTNKSGSGPDVAPFNTAFVQDTKEQSLGTVRGRLGWTPVPQTLIYATGGVAFGRVGVDEYVAAAPAFGASDSATLAGYVVGAGVEWVLPFLKNMSVKAEYLYVDYGTHRFFNPPITPGNCGCVVADVATNDSIFRVGLNYHFDWVPPMAVK